MKRVFWIAVGVGVTIFVVVKGKELMQMATPKGVAEQTSKLGRKLGDRVIGFMDTVQEGMAEREAELREALEMDASK